MYAIIRRYTWKGSVDRKSLDDFKRRIEVASTCRGSRTSAASTPISS